MIWLLLIPVIIYLTFQNMITSDFPVLDHAGGHRNFLEWCFTIGVACFISGPISLVPLGIGIFLGSLPDRVGKFGRCYICQTQGLPVVLGDSGDVS